MRFPLLPTEEVAVGDTQHDQDEDEAEEESPRGKIENTCSRTEGNIGEIRHPDTRHSSGWLCYTQIFLILVSNFSFFTRSLFWVKCPLHKKSKYRNKFSLSTMQDMRIVSFREKYLHF